MATSKKRYTRHKLTGSMLKRLAQLAANNGHHHGTSMGALRARGLVEDGEEHTEAHGYGQTRTVCLPCCRLTEEGRQALEDARAAGW